MEMRSLSLATEIASSLRSGNEDLWNRGNGKSRGRSGAWYVERGAMVVETDKPKFKSGCH